MKFSFKMARDILSCQNSSLFQIETQADLFIESDSRPLSVSQRNIRLEDVFHAVSGQGGIDFDLVFITQSSSSSRNKIGMNRLRSNVNKIWFPISVGKSNQSPKIDQIYTSIKISPNFEFRSIWYDNEEDKKKWNT